ncbi:MAG TPA: flavin reductase family protein [Aestuariivirgaceae bacterium]|nr:flavin reductase family protein [Aestuariivirgaceae bacterium]
MKTFRKKNLPPDDTRRYLEPGPIVLVSSAWKGRSNIMTMGWHMMMGFSPALFTCYIWDANHSFDLIRKSKQCVINLPTIDLLNEVIGIGNCSGSEVDKFAKFGLTTVAGTKVDAPLIKECFANLECRLYDGSQISKHGLFIWEVVKGHVAMSPKYPETVHYRGAGVFMISGRNVSRRGQFKAQNL